MKSKYLLFVLFTLLLSCCISDNALTIVEDGPSNYEIIISDDSTITTKKEETAEFRLVKFYR